MFGLGTATKIYLGVEAVDMRKGFEGLFGLVRDHLGQDPLKLSDPCLTGIMRNQFQLCFFADLQLLSRHSMLFQLLR